METKHTPTPWKVDAKQDEIVIHAPWSETVKAGEAENYGDYRGAYIAYVPSQGDNAPVVTKRQAEANAAFIVRAVNAHETLLAALKKSVEIHKAAGLNRFDVAELEQAIAKAGDH